MKPEVFVKNFQENQRKNLKDERNTEEKINRIKELGNINGGFHKLKRQSDGQNEKKEE